MMCSHLRPGSLAVVGPSFHPNLFLAHLSMKREQSESLRSCAKHITWSIRSRPCRWWPAVYAVVCDWELPADFVSQLWSLWWGIQLNGSKASAPPLGAHISNDWSIWGNEAQFISILKVIPAPQLLRQLYHFYLWVQVPCPSPLKALLSKTLSNKSLPFMQNSYAEYFLREQQQQQNDSWNGVAGSSVGILPP